jgi:hypothetical protein
MENLQGINGYSREFFSQVNIAAIAALPAILQRILPGGKFISGEYIVKNPTRPDRNAGSFRINPRTGKWADFATGDAGGDPISLVAYIEGLRQGEAALLLAGMLGIGGHYNG